MVCVGFCGNAFSVHVPNIGCRFTGAFVTSYGLLTAAAAIFAGSSFFLHSPHLFPFNSPLRRGISVSSRPRNLQKCRTCRNIIRFVYAKRI